MSKIAMINASPKVVLHRTDDSVSYRMLLWVWHSLKRERGIEFQYFHLKIGNVSNEDYKDLLTCDTWILAFPIYTGALPAHMMMFMQRIRNLATQFPEKGTPTGMTKPIRVYAVANGSLYEGNEAENAFDMLAFWCDECGFQWGNGLGVGGGPIFSVPNPFNRFRVHRSFARCLSDFTAAVRLRKSAGNVYCSPDISKKSYVLRMNRILRRKKLPGGKSESLMN